jgi:hypothetical protein
LEKQGHVAKFHRKVLLLQPDILRRIQVYQRSNCKRKRDKGLAAGKKGGINKNEEPDMGIFKLDSLWILATFEESDSSFVGIVIV